MSKKIIDSQLKKSRRLSLGVRAKLVMAFACTALAIVGTTLISVVSFQRFESTLQTVTVDKVPALVGAMSVAMASSDLQSLLPLLASSENNLDRESVLEKVNIELSKISPLSEKLSGTVDPEELVALENTLSAEIAELNAAVSKRIKDLQNQDQLVKKVIATNNSLDRELLSIVNSATRSISNDSSSGNTSSKVGELRTLLEVRANTNMIAGIMAEAAQSQETEGLKKLQSKFNGVGLSLGFMSNVIGKYSKDESAGNQVRELMSYGQGKEAIFALRQNLLKSFAEIQFKLEEINSSIAFLLSQVDTLVESTEGAVKKSSIDASSVIESNRAILIRTTVVSLIVTVLIAWLLVSRNIVGRMLAVTRGLNALAEGDLKTSVQLKGNDELSQLAETLEVFRAKALENERLVESEKKASLEFEQQQAERNRLLEENKRAEEKRLEDEQLQIERERKLAETLKRDTDSLLQVVNAAAMGDLTQTVSVAGTGPTLEMANAFQTLQNSFSEILERIKSSADSVSHRATQLAGGNSDLSRRTDKQAANLQETAASMEKMTLIVQKNTESSQNANQLAGEAHEAASRGSNAVGEIANAMNAINESGEKISEIINVIDDIALQTNLLALNAAVEAARAGEQGRGFAVVASEVRNLAGRSALAAKEIKELIEDSVAKVEHGVSLVDESGSTLVELLSSVKEVNELIAEIAVTSEKQNNEIRLANTAIRQMDEMTQKNATLVEQAAGQSESIASEAELLRQEIAVFTFSGTSTAVTQLKGGSKEAA